MKQQQNKKDETATKQKNTPEDWGICITCFKYDAFLSQLPLMAFLF